MKLNMITIIVAVAIILAATSAFIAYNYLHVNIDFSSNGVYIGKTINTSELFHTDKFSWYAYNATYNYLEADPNWMPPLVSYLKFEFNDELYNGVLSKHERDIHIGVNSTGYNLTQINDVYWDASGMTCINASFQVYENSIFRNSGYLNETTYQPYEKYVLWLPYGCNIAPRGMEKVTIGNITYDCQKYYLPNQIHNGISSGERSMYWFNDTIPIPVKLYNLQENLTYELAGWG